MTCTEQKFLKDVEKHEMTIIRDDGVHRHIKFQEPGTSVHKFSFLTWPGYLCYTGDMGTFVFSRLEDMFKFFRGENQTEKLYINPDYWAEKLQAIDTRSGVKEFDAQEFKKVVCEYHTNWVNENTLSKTEHKELWTAVNEVLKTAEEGEYEAMEAVRQFNCQNFCFDELYVDRVRIYTYHYIWCCYALAWGIKHYDELSQLAKQYDQAIMDEKVAA